MFILVNKTIECERYFKPSKVMKGTEQKNQDSNSRQQWRNSDAFTNFFLFLVNLFALLCSSLLDRWEVLVEIERKRVEFFTSRVTFERSELVPPMLSSVFPYRRVFLVQSVVQEEGYGASDKRFRGERDIHHIVELSNM